jgi:3-phosphoshikimate 1-carboxyvinyltransferase
LILSTLAYGESRIRGLLDSEDIKATFEACRKLGMTTRQEDDVLIVNGSGLHNLKAPEEILDLGNSGTAMRLLTGVLAAQPFASGLSGDATLNARPMNRITHPLQLMGASLSTGENGKPPITIRPCPGGLQGIEYISPVASAQVKSCVLLAGLYASGRTEVCEPGLSRDHTERMMQNFGVDVRRSAGKTGIGTACCSIEGGSVPKPANIEIPGDISSAAFFMVAATIIPGSDIVLSNVGLNETRDGILRVMERMGADFELISRRSDDAEPAGDIRVRYCPHLEAMDIPEHWIPSLIDELPAIMVLASQASGITRIRGAAELRVKESDRLSVMARGLTELGVQVSEYRDGMDIRGQRSRPGPGAGSKGFVEAAGDHRCAMSFCLLGQIASGEVTINGAENISTSYPEFARHLTALGGRVGFEERVVNS